MTFRTGFCGRGQHEGTRPKSPSGTPMKVCLNYDQCKCECHELYNQMHELSGIPRTGHDNPEYVPYVRSFWVPTFDQMEEARAATSAESLGVPTPTKVATISRGRAIGVLETNVKAICDLWLASGTDEYCTTKYVSDYIYVNYEIRSGDGAIREVFLRWERDGYAMIGQKPLRYMGLTLDGMKFGLEKLRERSVQAKHG